MSAGRSILFTIGRAIDGLGLAPLGRKLGGALYTLYKAKDLGAFGRGSSIAPFCVFQGAQRIRLGAGTHLRAGCHLQAVDHYEGAGRKGEGATGAPPALIIGDGVLIGRYCHFTAVNRIEIGRNVLFGERIVVADHDHGFQDPDKPPRIQPLSAGSPVIIGDDCWIGDGAAILAGTTLGQHVVVGANAVVTGDVPDFTVVAGNPARAVSRYDAEARKWINVSS